MKVSVETLPASQAVLAIDCSWEDLEKYSDTAYKKISQQVDIPGFRKGKAPRSLVERKVGREYVYQEGLEELIIDVSRSTLKEHNLVPLSEPELDAPKLEMDKPYSFRMTVSVLPQIQLGEYKSLHFDPVEVHVASSEVEEFITQLLNQKASWQEVQRPVTLEDRIVADLKLEIGEKVISDLKENTFELTDDRYGLFQGMDEHIVGMSAGESKNFVATISTGYANEELAGKEASYQITVHKVEEKVLPELDDSFAQSISEYTSLEELRKEVGDHIFSQKTQEAEKKLKEEIARAIASQIEVVLPALLIDEESENILYRMWHMFQGFYASEEQFLQSVKKSREEYLQEVRSDAESIVKERLIINAIAEKEQITLTRHELEQALGAYMNSAGSHKITEHQIHAFEANLRRDKTLQYLVKTLTTSHSTDDEA